MPSPFCTWWEGHDFDLFVVLKAMLCVCVCVCVCVRVSFNVGETQRLSLPQHRTLCVCLYVCAFLYFNRYKICVSVCLCVSVYIKGVCVCAQCKRYLYVSWPHLSPLVLC